MDNIILNEVQDQNFIPIVKDLPPEDGATERHKQENAFYSAAFNGGSPKEDYPRIRYDLDTLGSSTDVDQAKQDWVEEQNVQNDVAIKDIITDPSIEPAHKSLILNSYQNGLYVSKDLKDKFVQKTAALDNTSSMEDSDMQDALARGLYNNYQKQKDLEITMYEAESNLSTSRAEFAAGAARDIFVPGIYNVDNALSAQKAAQYFGLKDKAEMQMMFKAAFLGGSHAKEINKAFNNTLDPEQKKEFFMHLMEGAKQIPGFDFNKWSILEPQISSQPPEWWETALLNAASIADVVNAGFFFRSPARWLKGLYTYEDSKLAQAVAKQIMPTARTIPTEKIDPTITKQAQTEQATKASNGATGTGNGIVTASVDETASIVPQILPSKVLSDSVQPKVKPTSPIGLASIANPKQAREMSKAALMNDAVAESMGTTKGEIIGSNLLPKLDDDFVKNNPDIAADIQAMDKKVNELFEESKFDPFLVNVTERNDEKFKLFKAFSETNGAHYQQSNSSLRESMGAIEGKARYGRNADFGFSSAEDATRAQKQIDERFITQGEDAYNTKVVEDAGQWYVEMDWKRKYDPFSAKMFGENSADSSFAGINTSGFTKGPLAKHVFPATTRLDEWVPKGAFTATVQAARVEGEFLKFIDSEIRATPYPVEFTKATTWTQENGKWMNRGELSSMFPNIPMKELPKLERAYKAMERLSDYTYLWADRKHTNDMLADGFSRGIYSREGDILGYAKEVDSIPASVKQVWDYDNKVAIQYAGVDNGRTIVKLRDPVRNGDAIFDYAAVGGGTKLDIMPQHTLSKIDGYIARKNIEPWYVVAIPKKLNANGAAVDAHMLVDYARTIGAGKSRKDVDDLVRKLEKEYPDHKLDVKQEKGDIGDTILTDYKVYKEMTDWGNKRGERLPTLDGFSRLEDPLVAQTRAIRASVRLDAWKNYEEVLQKNFMSAYGRFIPNGKFPNVLTDLKPTNVMTPKDLEDFKIAQRIFENYSNSKFKITMGDEVWKDTLHKIADVVEDGKLGGQADNIREIANKGNLGVKSTKSLANTLFINLNSIAQWIVQPQAILEFAAVDSKFRNDMHMIPGLLQAIMARASNVKPYRSVLEDIAKFGVKDKKEFEQLVEAIYKSGLPQSVDMNMMLHGGLDDMAKSLDPTLAQKAGQAIAYIPDKVNNFGKAIGYTPAQMTADIGGWLFARARWQKLNPGKSWNTPEAIAQITADGWDIMGNMHTRAAALPYQDGLISTLFQFQAILHKNMFNMFASKTLKKAPGEVVDPKVKLAAARMFIYGKYGVPGYALVDQLVSNFADSDVQAEWHKWGGGLSNIVLNKTIDIFLSDPDSKEMDLALSSRIGPMAETLPYYEIIHELVKFGSGDRPGMRVPVFAASGAIYEAANDFLNIMRATDVETPEAAMLFLQEAAELSSGYNNWVKAQLIMEMQDKTNKLGVKQGLELQTAHAVAQMFGIMSQQELNQYKMSENKKERETFIEERASQIHNDLVKLKGKVGTPEFLEWVRRTKVLNTATPAPLQQEVFDRVLRKDKESFMTRQESNIMYLTQNAQLKNDKYIEEMMGYLKSCNSDVCQQNLKRLVDNGFIKGD